MKAMVLAAGVGSRLEPLTSQVPKPLVPIANRPVMEHILALLKTHGITEVMSNLHYQPDKIQNHFGDGAKFGMNLHFHHEKELSGDAGGVRACKAFLQDSTFIVLMGDLLTDANLNEVIARHKEKKALATIAIKQVDDVSNFGVVLTNEKGFITGFQEKPKPAEALSNHASTGIYILEPEVFKYIPASGSYGFGRQLFPLLVEKGLPVLAVPIDQYYWSDVGTIHQYRLSNFAALNHEANIVLAGKEESFGYVDTTAKISGQANIEGKLLIGKHSQIGPGVTIKGNVLIGDNCNIKANAHLEDTIVWSGSTIGTDAQLTDCVVGYNCVIADGTIQNEIASVSRAPSTV